MAQKPQVIDLTRSYVPGDPNAFPMNLIATSKEDQGEKEPPVLIYEGYNFIPTAYGYRSYFGDNSKLDIDGLASRCDELLIYQLGNRKNIIIAFCEDGLWYTASTTLTGALWTQGVTLAVPTVGTYKQWTYTVIENILYMYRQGEPHYWKITPTGFTDVVSPVGIALTIDTVVPSFLNMAGQLGIFRANASLAFWDSATSIGWSSPLDLQDFTPSITTFAGNAIFSGILGSIVTVKSQGDGFIIYTTKGIVGVRYVQGSTLIWEATTITDTAGVSSPKEVTGGMTENEHFAYTSTGIKKIGSYNALNKMHAFENILPEIYDILRENEEFVYLNFMNGRYLFFSLLRNDYISGLTTFTKNDLGGIQVHIELSGEVYIEGDLLPTISNSSLDALINAAVSAGDDNDMYLQWSGSGVGSYIAFTTPMHNYEMDGRGIYIPNDNYSGASFVVSGDAQSAPLGSFITQCTPDYPTDYNQLGYIGYGSIAAGTANLGSIDGGLPTYLDAQIEEWANFVSIQAANTAAFTSIPDSPTINTAGSSAITGTSSAVLSAAIASFMGSVSDPVQVGNTVTYTVEVAGEYLTGVGTTVGPIVTGGTSNYAECTLTRNFSGGKRIKRKASRTFSVRAGPSVESWSLLYVVSSGGLPMTPTRPPSGYIYGTSQIDCFLQLQGVAESILAVEYQDSSYYYRDRVWSDPSFSYSTDAHTVSLYYRAIRKSDGYDAGLNWFLYSNAPGGPVSHPNYTKLANTTSFYVDYSEYMFLEVSDIAKTDTSIMIANKSNLTWSTTTIPEDVNHTTGNTDSLDRVYPAVNFNATYPGATYLLQDGSPSPIYPTYEGALVLDTALKKWGKMKAQYQALLDYNSFNSANQNLTAFTNLGVDMAILKDDGFLYNMDAKPVDSYIKYGKLGYYRLGFTTLFEAKAHFRTPYVGTITIDTSINGVSVESTLSEATDFSGVIKVGLFPTSSGRWHTIKIAGNYDLQYLEFRGTIAGRR